MVDYTYFDEAYYQDGQQRGTAYRCYLQAAPQALFFREMAEIVQQVFRPTRALEIGCATGVAVKLLNDMGIETHGVDVSEWAVRHRAHPNVQLAGAEKLPFPDKHFDIVFSSGALEHVPPAVRDQAFRELDRVCKTHQFHMLPIVGEGPYNGPRDIVVQNLSTDKTHFNLLDRGEWLELFATIGWRDTGLHCVYAHDSISFENSWCQFILTRGEADPSIAQGVIKHNLAAAETMFQRGFEFTAPTFHPTAGERAVMGETGPVLDLSQGVELVAEFNPPIDVEGALFRIFLHVDADEPVFLRWAVFTGAGEDNLFERYLVCQPGHTMLQFRRTDWAVSKGDPQMRDVTRILFSGPGVKATVRTSLVAICGGEEIELLPPPPKPQPVVRKSFWPKSLVRAFSGLRR